VTDVLLAGLVTFIVSMVLIAWVNLRTSMVNRETTRQIATIKRERAAREALGRATNRDGQ
jgi:site-specific recombinase